MGYQSNNTHVVRDSNPAWPCAYIFVACVLRRFLRRANPTGNCAMCVCARVRVNCRDMFTGAVAFLQDLQPWSRRSSLGGLGAALDASLINYLALPQKAYRTLALDSGTLQLYPFANETDAAPTCGICTTQTKGSLITAKGEGKRGICVFPFTHAGTTYSACAQKADFGGVGWCAFDSNDTSGAWGHCTASCPTGTQLRSDIAAAAAAQFCHTVYAGRQYKVLAPRDHMYLRFFVPDSHATVLK